ncbi:carbohydrate ABC transporter permease [Paenibacillus marchantiophytorum]|uniref:carbohydrate ABC transporter permease n=1 Tax=Paenibacillus marchantiophytorum TaxID=1619310 RepID=UPI00166E4332|nr:sugar ABC transporter permease [Paenibacillus marchantiophytorum]
MTLKSAADRRVILTKPDRKTWFSSRAKDRWFLFFLLAPPMALLFLTLGIPILKSIYISFFDVTLLHMNDYRWNNFANYLHLWTEQDFIQALRTTLIYVIGIVILQFVLGILLASILNHVVRMRKLLRTVILIPWTIPTIVVALLWMWLFQPQYGILNYILVSWGIIDKPYEWLSSLHLALPAVMVAALWRQLPFMSTMLLAGMQGISAEIYEASRIDGANRQQTFWYITLPQLKNTIRTVTLIAMIENFKMFPLFWIMTGGGPLNATTTLAILSYKTAFIKLNLGEGAAIGVLWLLLLLGISWGYNKLFSIGEETQARGH